MVIGIAGHKRLVRVLCIIKSVLHSSFYECLISGHKRLVRVLCKSTWFA